MASEPGLDIVVVNWQTPDDLDAFLVSVEKFPPSVPYAVYVMNVEPTDIDWAIAERWVGANRGTGVHLVLPTNVGYARACNRGASLGSHDVIAFFNADIELTEDALDHCYDALTANRWAILGPRQVDSDGRLVHAGIFGTLDQPGLRGWRARDREGRFNDIRTDAVSVSGSAYFIQREVWDELHACPTFRAVDADAEGAFLTTPHYYEETWCSYHAQAHGHKVVYYGPVCITHRWHRASPVGGRAEQMLPESRRRFREACDAHGIPRD